MPLFGDNTVCLFCFLLKIGVFFLSYVLDHPIKRKFAPTWFHFGAMHLFGAWFFFNREGKKPKMV